MPRKFDQDAKDRVVPLVEDRHLGGNMSMHPVPGSSPKAGSFMAHGPSMDLILPAVRETPPEPVPDDVAAETRGYAVKITTYTYLTELHTSKGVGWALALVIAGIFTIDFSLFSEDHVPYWAYVLKFFALFFTLFTVSRFISGSANAKKLISLSVVSAISIAAFVAVFILM